MREYKSVMSKWPEIQPKKKEKAMRLEISRYDLHDPYHATILYLAEPGRVVRAKIPLPHSNESDLFNNAYKAISEFGKGREVPAEFVEHLADDELDELLIRLQMFEDEFGGIYFFVLPKKIERYRVYHDGASTELFVIGKNKTHALVGVGNEVRVLSKKELRNKKKFEKLDEEA